MVFVSQLFHTSISAPVSNCDSADPEADRDGTDSRRRWAASASADPAGPSARGSGSSSVGRVASDRYVDRVVVPSLSSIGPAAARIVDAAVAFFPDTRTLERCGIAFTVRIGRLGAAKIVRLPFHAHLRAGAAVKASEILHLRIASRATARVVIDCHVTS